MYAAAALLGLLAVLCCQVQGQSFQCQRYHTNYLQCLKSRMDRDYANLEDDFRYALGHDIKRCFLKSDCPFGGYKRRILAEDGPLRNCNMCQKFAQIFTKLFLEAEPESKRCFRGVLMDYTKREIEHCLNEKYQQRQPGIPYISIDSMPDMDEAGDTPQNAIKIYRNTMAHVSALFDIDTCNKIGKDGHTVKECLDSPSRGPLHCQNKGYCGNLVASQRLGCNLNFGTTESFVCQCFKEKRDSLKFRVEKAVEELKESNSAAECERTVLKYLGSTSGESWAEAATEALKCGKRLPNFLTGRGTSNTGAPPDPFKKILKYGCRLAVSHRAQARQVLEHGLIVGRYIIDAITHRVSRFCPGPCLEERPRFRTRSRTRTFN